MSDKVPSLGERLTRFFASRWGIILAGAAIGILAPLLQKPGNPPTVDGRSAAPAPLRPDLQLKRVICVDLCPKRNSS